MSAIGISYHKSISRSQRGSIWEQPHLVLLEVREELAALLVVAVLAVLVVAGAVAVALLQRRLGALALLLLLRGQPCTCNFDGTGTRRNL